ncbi:IgGFc-binding protein-like [Haliotis asinina]|uniref:IgGFc-binding protein-like n=1 Tax=Haliotis asinina TaxID=109174 RepID=UPI003531B9F2
MSHQVLKLSVVIVVVSYIVYGSTPVGDHKGKQFLLSFLKNGYGNGKPYILIMTETKAELTVRNHMEGEVMDYSLESGLALNIELPSSIRYSSDMEEVQQKTVTIDSTSDVSVYVMDYNSYSSEGYLAIPTSYLSTAYIAVSYTETSKYKPTLLVSATQEETTVTIKFKIQNDGTCGSENHLDGGTATFTLSANQTLGIVCTHDLTGTYVESTKPITLLSGHPCANVPDGIDGVDMLVEMIAPVKALGSSFVIHNLEGRDSGAIYRTVASMNGTEVTTSSGKVFSLDFGDYFDIDTAPNGEMCLTSNHPILVVMYGKSKKADTVVGDGDGFMAQVPSTDRFLSSYMADFSSLTGFKTYYARTVSTAGGNPTDYRSIPGCAFGVNFTVAKDSPIQVSMNGARFGAVVYGFMSAGGYEFPVGMVFDFDECESAPCVNGGSCKDGAYTYTCECPPEYTGVNCESGGSSDALSWIMSVTDIQSSSSPHLLPTSSTFTVSSPDNIVTSTIRTETYVHSTTSSPVYSIVSRSSLLSDIVRSSFSLLDVSSPSHVSSESMSFMMPSQASVFMTYGTSSESTRSLISSSLPDVGSYVSTAASDIGNVLESSPVLNLYTSQTHIENVTPLLPDPSLSSLTLTSASSASLMNPSVVISTRPNPLNLTTTCTSCTPSVPIPITPATSAIFVAPALPKSYTTACICTCVVNLATMDFVGITEEIKKRLTVPTHNLSSTIRKKISIRDNRPSAVTVGSAGIVLIVIATLIVTVPDILNMLQYIFGVGFQKPRGMLQQVQSYT